MELEQVAIENLTPHPRNARAHPQNQLEHLQESLDEYDWVRNIVTAKDGTILIGHGIVAAAKRNGHDTVPVYRTQLEPDDSKAIKLMVLENSVQDFAIDDEEQLATLLQDIEETEGLEGTGYDEEGLQDLLSELQAEELAGSVEDVEPDEPPEEPVTETGDVWLCGEHRVVCGDCTDVGVVNTATDNTKVTAILTDPPYGYQKDIAGDNDKKPDFQRLHIAFVNALPAANECTFVSFHSPRTFPMLLDVAREAGWKFERMLRMYKSNDETFPWRGWLLKSEGILVFSVGNGVWRDVHPYAHDTYLHDHNPEDLADDIGGHPSAKPLPVLRDLLSRVGDGAAFDGFLGAGTTLIAAEQLGRVCYGIEIEPRYVDVAVKRWMKATNKHAKLESTGESFPVSDDGG